MKLKDFLDSSPRGATFRLAESLKTTPVNVSNWANGRRRVPVHWCIRIEEATSGIVTRKDLRPDDYTVIWPELVGREDLR